MSGYLWKYYFEDNVDAFRHLLETSSYNARSGASKTHAFLGSPGSLGSSPTLLSRARKSATPSTISLSRTDINSRDSLGLTVLHYVASSTSENALGFALALLNHPLTDLYYQDFENGWTALHRAFYFGNVAIARLIIERERRQLLGGHGSSGHSQQLGGLMKIKDKEGNGPYDLFAMSIQDRILHHDDEDESGSESGDDQDETGSNGGDDEDGSGRRDRYRPQVNVGGDGVFTFGSNKNVTLGFGDEDDRQYPERIMIRRPDHLIQRFHREHLENKVKLRAQLHSAAAEAVRSSHNGAVTVTSLPTTVRVTPLIIQDVQMSKLHTAVLTTDPESNLYMCGHGPGGRLGTGSEATRYQFTCIEGGALTGKRVVAVGLGQNHSLALSSEGEIFSWGSNVHGQLGYTLPKTNVKDEEPIQTLPRQIFGPLKKEAIIGVAASRIHSVVHTSSSLYTFGKNEGQLGIMDSDARSLEVQVTPRKIAASLFSSNIHSVSAIDKATVCLLENHEVWVFANYGYSKVLFPLEGFANYFLKSSFLTTKYEKTPNRITKITSGGDTICAMSSSGEVFTVAVKTDNAQDAGTSTTNPTKIRGALSTPLCVWSAKKTHMAAKDVGVDQDGSIIITTGAGSVWRRTKRAKIKDATASGAGDYKPKDYKFARIPGLTRVSAVRSSSYGAYAAIRKDSDVTKSQIEVEEPTLWADLAPLLSFSSLATKEDDSDDEDPAPRFWNRPSQTDILQRRVLASQNLESDVTEALRLHLSDADSTYDAILCTSESEVRIPVHQFILAGRSKVLRDALANVEVGAPIIIPETLEIVKHVNGQVKLTLQALDFLTLFDLVLYLYTDSVVSFWQFARQFPALASRYRQVRVELMKVSSRLDLRQLEPAARQMVQPKRTMHLDFDLAINQPIFFQSGDITIQLADGEAQVHSSVLRQRCHFFEGMFNGRAGGMWLADRKYDSEDQGMIEIDLKHVNSAVFQMVLRHIYGEAEDEMFDHIKSDDLNDHFALDELLDLAIEVMGVANELMLSRLSQICQRVIGRYVTVRNVCSLVNSIAPCAVTEFKDAALEYICLNLEAIVQGGLLDELDEDLMLELDQVVHDNQLACLPIARSGRAEAMLFERHPELAERIDKGKRAKIDAIVLSNKFVDTDRRVSTSFRSQSLEEISSSPLKQRSRKKSSKEAKVDGNSPAMTPNLKGKQSTELLFDMDEDDAESNVALSPPSGKHSRFEQSPNIEPIPFSLSQTNLSIGSPEFTLPESPTFTPPAHASGRAWGSTPLQAKKLDMKDIMAQTTGDRQSGLSLAFSSQPRTDDRPVGSFNATKVSQKQRKRLQQIPQAQGLGILPVKKDEAPAVPVSPWSSSKLTAALKPDTTRRVSTPQLTMRQTVAKSGPASKAKQSDSIETPPPRRSVSGPVQQSSPASTKQQPPSSSSSQAAQSSITPRSVRHTPLPDRSLSAQPQASMHYILSQQQAEKDYINTPEKRSLEEIQQEQAFQEWWDAESKRVIQEEENRQRKERPSIKRGGGRSRGGKSKAGDKSKGGDSKPAEQQAKPSESSEATPAAPSTKTSTNKRAPKQHTPSEGSAHRGGRGSRGRGGRHQSERGKGKDKQPSSSAPSTSAAATTS